MEGLRSKYKKIDAGLVHSVFVTDRVVKMKTDESLPVLKYTSATFRVAPFHHVLVRLLISLL